MYFMKKSLIVFLLVIVVLLPSCIENTKIKSVTADNVKYETVYLYSFENAEINEISPFMINYTKPKPNGYIYSCNKLSPGDTIKVWNNILFKSNNQNVILRGNNGSVQNCAVAA